MGIVLFLTLFVIIMSLFVYGEHFSNDVEYMQSSIDNMYYLVRNLPDKQQAADLLSQVNIRVKQLLQHLRSKYNNEPVVNQLLRNYNEHQLSENSTNSQLTSYSINKGEKIILCLRHRNNKNHALMDINTVMFVIIHELSHLCTKSIGHTNEFWHNMKFLLKEAISINIYSYVAYHKSPQQYCGTLITDTPYKLDS